MPEWAEELVPETVPVQYRELKLRKVLRYWCFRLQTEATEGTPATGIPEGLKSHYEQQEWFDEWENFGVTWDVEEGDLFLTRPRYVSVHEEWDAVLQQQLQEDKMAARKRKRMMANGSEGEL